ncbi:MAG: hypothetical protein ACSHX8_04405 [Opitutaceae bacterium]
MRKTGNPTLFYWQPDISARFESWPVCPRRVRYRQSTDKYGQKTWGVFTLDARDLGESEIRYESGSRDCTHVTDRRFLEWLMDSDQHSDEVLVFPDHWWSLTSLIDKFVRSKRIDAFCIQCNRTHAHKNLVKEDDDSAGPKKYIYNRLYCPDGHLLLNLLVMRKNGSPSLFRNKQLPKRHLEQARFDFC